MKTTNILFWVFTVLFALYMGGGAIPSLIDDTQSVALFDLLGYPAYLIAFLSIAKILGSIAILVPGYPRLKEWAYAGLVFDLTGATYSMIMTGQPASTLVFMLAGYVLFAGSYIFYHKRRKASATGSLQAAI